MTSKDPEIQHIYDQIKDYKTTHPYKCICVKKCDHCDDHTKAMKSNLPTAYELEMLVKRLTGVQYGFNSRPMKWDEPFIPANSKQQINYSDWIYHILFIDYGFMIFMTRDMIKKIPILKSILLENNGSDKPIRLNYIDEKLNKVFKGPHMYVTKLEPHSLVFGNPPDDYKMNIDRRSNNEQINFKEKWFKHDNLGECLMHRNWYA
tara:strand:+ start:453 stop:1067 length:615 start_codon:yes stop_codon:yes gene_type:complete